MAVRAEGLIPSPALPALLTVEEAAEYLRIGRTKAYAMAREWRETGGRSGLPVVDFGHLLRVPRHKLEGMIGAELGQLPAAVPPERLAAPAVPVTSPEPPLPEPPAVTTDTPPSGRRPRQADRSSNQLNLFDPSS
jgi:excisionase family DNA binding protein